MLAEHVKVVEFAQFLAQALQVRLVAGGCECSDPPGPVATMAAMRVERMSFAVLGNSSRLGISVLYITDLRNQATK